ncbi:hypothetical protein FOA52_010599 [Chlamydomonas sp. UWO 241]|nr:hypothetical protein FOA52_010599 [Chlamydomonas sp. UWO 241]
MAPHAGQPDLLHSRRGFGSGIGAAAAASGTSAAPEAAGTTASSPTPLVLSACVYISEGRCQEVLSRLEATLRAAPGTALLHIFMDAEYNRTGYTLASLSPDALTSAVVAVCREAIGCVDLRSHKATHPRLGVADHVSVQPLAWPEASSRDDALASAASVARSIGRQLLGSCEAQGKEAAGSCPVYYYGAAYSSGGRRLADVRRALGYFRPDVLSAGAALWAGELGVASLSHFPPDEGPCQVSPRTGVATIGAVPFVLNYNVPLQTVDLAFARTAAKAVSERGGGLRGVEAMALFHGEGCVEVACNLLDVGEGAAPADVQAFLEEFSGLGALSRLKVLPWLRAAWKSRAAFWTSRGGAAPAEVHAFLERTCAPAGVSVGQGYTTGKTAEQLVQMMLAQLSGDGSAQP